MLTPEYFALTLSLLTAGPLHAAISRADLLDMATKHVDPKVILALVQRDCVDFDITPATAVELSKTLSPDILDAAIECRQHSASPTQPSTGASIANTSSSVAPSAAAIPATLENQGMRLRRSYRVPDGSPTNFVWLQFGTKEPW